MSKKFKFDIGEKVLNDRIIMERFIGYNINGRVTKMYAWKFDGDSEDAPPLFSSEETIVRKQYRR
jgi:hypothetical protein